MPIPGVFTRGTLKWAGLRIGTVYLTCLKQGSRRAPAEAKKGKTNELSMVILHGQVVPTLPAPVLFCTDCGSSLPERAVATRSIPFEANENSGIVARFCDS